jgi:biotin transport system substrate-specific component
MSSTPLPVPATLAAALWPAARPGAARAAATVLVGSLVLAVSAKVQVPLWPVPMTLQTLVVLVLGAACGPVLGTAAVAAYLVQGLLGLPVFAGPLAGPAYLAGPTGGFLLGFLPAAALTGILAARGLDRTLPRLLLAMALGHAVIFAVGVAWLALSVGPAKAWALGAAPFAVATLVKTALAAALLRAGWSYAQR